MKQSDSIRITIAHASSGESCARLCNQSRTPTRGLLSRIPSGKGIGASTRPKLK
jgi:hypothetical protein